LGVSLKAEGFGDGESRPSKTGRNECRRSHPQAFDKLRWGAALEPATLPNYQIKFDRVVKDKISLCRRL
jgi:hypothetical protein